MDFGIDLVHETMSGATPWFVEPDANGEPVVVMTGASVEDQRTDFNGHGTYYFDTARMNLQSGYSTEDDYSAINVGFGTEHDFDEKNTTLSWGLGLVDGHHRPDRNRHEPEPVAGRQAHDLADRRLVAGDQPQLRLPGDPQLPERRRLPVGPVQAGLGRRRERRGQPARLAQPVRAA